MLEVAREQKAAEKMDLCNIAAIPAQSKAYHDNLWKTFYAQGGGKPDARPETPELPKEKAKEAVMALFR